MPTRTTWIFSTSMDVNDDKVELFNEVYEQEHIPELMKVPGVVAVTRYETKPLSISMGGEVKSFDGSGEPRYTAVYEVESPDVLTSDAWARAVDTGRWPTEVRPFTSNRRLMLQKVVSSKEA